MAKLWSKHVGETFFYSFEHVIKQNKHGGSQFLTGLPLVENDGVEGGKLIGSRTPLTAEKWTLETVLHEYGLFIYYVYTLYKMLCICPSFKL